MMRGEGSSVARGSRGHGPGIKKSKPAMEKRRRARINASLAELRSLIPDSVKRGNRRYTKMEKADILEMAVQYLRLLQGVNKDKSQVNTVSYSLGFNECTQEVSEFLRSSSPATNRFKGSLLEHLSDCAHNNQPDSPSSSPKILSSKSISGTFSTSSIIARCLLSSTTVTPAKVSRNVRNSSTPAAVSSTSDDCNIERITPLEERPEHKGDTLLESTSPHHTDLTQVQRSDVFKVKKDLINYFNVNFNVCKTQPAKPSSKSPTGQMTIAPSSVVQESNILFKQRTSDERNQIGIKSTNSVVAEEDSSYPDEGALCAAPTVYKVEDKPLDKEKETVTAPYNTQAETISCDKIESQTKDESSRKIGQQTPQSSDRNKNSNQESTCFSPTLISLAATDSAVQEINVNQMDPEDQTPDKVSNNISDTLISNVTTRSSSTTNTPVKYTNPDISVSQSTTKPDKEVILFKEDDFSYAGSAIELDTEQATGQLQGTAPSVTSGVLDLTKTVYASNGKLSIQRNTASSNIPQDLQASAAGDHASVQQAILNKCLDKINIRSDKVSAPDNLMQTATTHNADIKTSEVHHSLLQKNNLNPIQIVFANAGFSTFTPDDKLSPKSRIVHCSDETGLGTRNIIHNREHNSRTTIEVEAQSDTSLVLSKLTPPCHQLRAHSPKENYIEQGAIPKPSSPTYLLSPVNVDSATNSHSLKHSPMKRPLSPIKDMPEGLSVNSKSVHEDNLSNQIKRMRLNLQQPQFIPNFDQSSALLASISTKFRPIAPKKEALTPIKPDLNYQARQRSPGETGPIVNNCFKESMFSYNLPGHKKSAETEHRHCEINSICPSSEGEDNQHTAPKSCNISMSSMDGTSHRCVGNDDILTTALKSIAPMTKTRPPASRFNGFNTNNHIFNEEHDSHRSSQFKQRDFTNHPSFDVVFFGQASHNNKTNLVEKLMNVKSALDSRDRQATEKCDKIFPLKTATLLSDVEGAQPAHVNHTTRSPTYLNTLSECNRVSTSLRYAPHPVSPVQRNTHSSRDTRATSDNYRCNPQQPEPKTSRSDDFQIYPNKNGSLIFDFKDTDQVQGHTLIGSSQLNYRAVSSQPTTTWKEGYARGNIDFKDENKSQQICESQCAKAALSYPQCAKATLSYPAPVSPEPLNLSLGDEQTNKAQSTHFVEKNIFHDLECQYKQTLSEATPVPTYFTKDLPTTPRPHTSSHIYLREARLPSTAHHQQELRLSKTNNSFIINELPSLYPVDRAVQNGAAEFSHRHKTLTNQSELTNSMSRIPFAAHGNQDTSSRNIFVVPNNLPSVTSQTDSEHQQEHFVCTKEASWPTTKHVPSQRVSFLSLDSAAATQLRPFVQFSTTNSHTETADDDVWRPW